MGIGMRLGFAGHPTILLFNSNHLIILVLSKVLDSGITSGTE